MEPSLLPLKQQLQVVLPELQVNTTHVSTLKLPKML